jgi:ParB/RepB/Spo0J family partition protein
MAEIKEVTLIDIKKLIPNEYNPNEQTLEQLEQLVKEIDQDGFDHPLQVVPKGKKFMIIGGEHRWKAATILGYKKVPCSVYDEWTEEDQKLKTVRRNMLRGTLNDAKFTRLVQSVADEGGKEQAIIAKEMGFQEDADFLRHIISEEKEEEKRIKDSVPKEKPDLDVEAIESVTDIVNNILVGSGGDIGNHFMFFSYGGKTHLMTIMDDALLSEIELATKHVRDNDLNMCEYMTELLQNERKKRG